MHLLFRDLKIAYESCRSYVLYNFLIEFGFRINPARVMKMCPNGTYGSVPLGKHLSEMFIIRNGLNQDFLLH